jgi:hypothetical protein
MNGGKQMAMATIEIQLDEKTADQFARASRLQQEKLRLLLSLWLQEFEDSSRDLGQLMDEISDNAAARGLTPEVLESLLGDE